MKAKLRYRINYNMSLIVLILILLYPPIIVLAQEAELNWVEGPNTVTLGNNVAKITFGEDYIFADGDDTRKLMERIGNPPTNNEVGVIIPKNYELGWFVVFEYYPAGYIKDDDRNTIDADAILKSIKKGTEKSNKYRQERGVAPFHVLGWYQEPYYDTNTNNLTWTLLGRSEDSEKDIETANHNIRLLGRYGYMSVVLVAERSTLASFKPEVDAIISNFSFVKGNRYAEYVKGDKVAKYGLTALVAGGAAAVAAKTGIFKMLAKFAKFIFIAVIGFFASIWSKIKALFRKSDKIHMSNT